MDCSVKSGEAIEVNYENNATVVAEGNITGTKVNDSDLSHYKIEAKPSIKIEKSTNGADADTEAEAVVLNYGDSVTWSYRVTNRGSEPLKNIVVKDDKEGNVTCPKATLDINESMDCSVKSGEAIAGKYVNEAIVTAEDLEGKIVTDKDLSHYIGTLCLGDKVWLDSNYNHIKDNNEIGLDGVSVKLYDDSGAVIAETITNSSGDYKFCGLEPADYRVEFVKSSLPKGYVFVKQYVGDSSKDSNANIDTGMSDTIHLTTKDDMTIDAGVFPAACIGNKVWEDLNGNGIQDENEPGIEGVKVQVLDKDAKPIKNVYGEDVNKQITDSNGTFKECLLRPKFEYRVKFTNPNKQYEVTVKDNGDDSVDSDIDAQEGLSEPILLQDGENNMVLAAGYIKTICLGDYMWYDKNLNGVQDDGEGSGVTNMTVTLLDANGNIAKDVHGNEVKPIKTDSNGKYKFCHLQPAKDYKIKFEIPESYLPTTPKQGSSSKDSDANSEGIIEVKNPVKDDMTLDTGIYCECDDYKVNPQEHKSLKASALDIAGIILMLTTIGLFARRRED